MDMKLYPLHYHLVRYCCSFVGNLQYSLKGARYSNLNKEVRLIVKLHLNRNIVGSNTLSPNIRYVNYIKIEAAITHFFDSELKHNG
jgi:hypothetical protein